jgi:hypothetical protein
VGEQGATRFDARLRGAHVVAYLSASSCSLVHVQSLDEQRVMSIRWVLARGMAEGRRV